MPDNSFTDEDLVVALQTLKPYLKDMVICGGWTLRIYRNWILKDSGPLPIVTLDVDIAVRPKMVALDQTVDELLSASGYKPAFRGMNDPMAVYEKEGAPDIEFLTPRKGNREPKPISIQKGLKAEPLRYLEVVLDNTRKIQVPKADLSIRVPEPEAYFYQKGLSFTRRASSNKKGKDLAYLFEFLHNFPELSGPLPDRLLQLRKAYPASWFKTFVSNLKKHFGDEDFEGANLVTEQTPHPFEEMVLTDPTNGPGLFRELVRGRFQELLRKL